MKEEMKSFVSGVLVPISIIIVTLLLTFTFCGFILNYGIRETEKIKQPHEAFIVKTQTEAQIKMNEQKCKSLEYCLDAVASIFGK